MHWTKALLCFGFLLVSSLSFARHAPTPDELQRGPVNPRFRETSVANIDRLNRVHRAGAMWMNITNWGYFGNYGIDSNNPIPMLDPEYPDLWAPQCEYPGGSEVQYLYQGSLWLGALIQEEGYEYPRVSCGAEGWIFPRIHEFNPGEEPDPIIERTTRPNTFNRLGDYISSDEAVSEQDMIAVYQDTLTDPTYVETDPMDGPHVPLGIKIRQTSYSWSYAYARDFIIIDWEVENIADNFLKNLYVGLYIDADVGANWEQYRTGTNAGHTDDVCGFQEYYYYENAAGVIDSSVINTAWIADNDGRPADVSTGSEFSTPHVSGTRVLRAPNPHLRTSFNWWISNNDEGLDFGPAWFDDGAAGEWTTTLGTPLGDSRKYFVLGNREFDYDQIYVNQPTYIRGNPQDVYNPATGETEEHQWRIPDAENADDLANGYDTRYLLSWGPLGIFDYIDDAGNRIYRLNPGESFSMTIAYVAGQNFHDRNHFQPSNQVIDPSLYNFADIRYNADWASKVYDNPMIDTNGDGWYGEDTGEDHLYAETPGDSIFIDGLFIAVYPGRDPGEGDESLQHAEDYNPYKPERYDYSSGNGMLDLGDNEPDFRGPPPPPVPILTHIPDEFDVRLRWSTFPSEDEGYQDPFSRLQDFEGYRIYTSATGLESDYSFVAEYDRIDYAYFTDRDSMLTTPVPSREGIAQDTIIDDIHGILRPVGPNIGLEELFAENDTTYEYRFESAHPLMPRWYAVTAYDYGDPKSGTPSLETSKSANAIFVAPAGDPRHKPGVAPNPYRADQDYTVIHGDGLAWENRDDGTPRFFPQTDRRIWFYNLPEECIIRVYTVAGDLVQLIPHNVSGDRNTFESLEHAESWDLNSRNNQQVVSGLYLFSVEDKTSENHGNIEVGKFVIIR